MNENLIVSLQEQGIVTPTFRRLSPVKKEKLYKTSLQAFSSDVFDRVSLDDLADAAEVSKGSLFQYFGDKENLLYFVCEIFIDEYRRFWDRYFTQERAVRAHERIKSLLMEQVAYFAERKTEGKFYMVIKHETGNDLSRKFTSDIGKIHHEHLLQIVSRGQETGEIRADLSSKQVTELVQIVSEGILHKIISGGKLHDDYETGISKAIAALFDGIRR